MPPHGVVNPAQQPTRETDKDRGTDKDRDTDKDRETDRQTHRQRTVGTHSHVQIHLDTVGDIQSRH